MEEAMQLNKSDEYTRTSPRMGSQLLTKPRVVTVPNTPSRGNSSQIDEENKIHLQSIIDTAVIHDDGSIVDEKLHQTRRYLRSARALYELQFHSKRPTAMLRMKPNPYGFKSGSTFDALAAFVSPIRGHQVLEIVDDWTSLEICIFEDAFERHGKDFHAIAQKLPNKTVQAVISFYYVWKKHCLRDYDSDESLGESYTDVSGDMFKLVEDLKHRRHCTKMHMTAARAMNCPSTITKINLIRAPLAEFGLHRLTNLHPAIAATSPLRSSAVLDTWTPLEIRVFELAMECYGKHFHQVADMIKTKTCREVIAFYYLWKKDPYYQLVKRKTTSNQS